MRCAVGKKVVAGVSYGPNAKGLKIVDYRGLDHCQ
jgi:hypothetical protein